MADDRPNYPFTSPLQSAERLAILKIDALMAVVRATLAQLDDAATATLATTAPITLTSIATGTTRNTTTLTTEVEAPAPNPSDSILVDFSGTADAIVATVTPNDGTNNPANDPATGVLDLTADITLTSVAKGTGRNTNTLTTQVLAAAANPTNTILVSFTGTSAAIVCTVTPNDGTHNSATAVNLTTANLTQLINSGLVTGKVITLTDASALRALQTATGGGATNLADGGEGDGVVATFSGGTDVAVDMTTAELAELISTGAVSGKTTTITDPDSLRELQSATGGDTTDLADGGEGDGEVATFSGGTSDFANLASALTTMQSDIGVSDAQFKI